MFEHSQEGKIARYRSLKAATGDVLTKPSLIKGYQGIEESHQLGCSCLPLVLELLPGICSLLLGCLCLLLRLLRKNQDTAQNS